MYSNVESTATPLAPDLSTAFAFLHALDPGAETFTFQTFDDNKARGDQSLTRIIHGNLDDVWLELAQLNFRGAGIFVTVNATDSRGRKTQNITRVRAIWGEFDHGVPVLPLEASIVVESSPGKEHHYFLADDLTAQDHAVIMARMVESYGSDKNAKDLARVLRLPGFWHVKGAPHLVTLKAVTGRRYGRAALLGAFPPLGTTSKPVKPGQRTVPLAEIRSALRTVPADDRDVWLRVGQALKHDYGEAGFAVWDAWSQHSAKYDPEDQERVWHSIRREAGEGNVVTGATILHLAHENGWQGFRAEPKDDFDDISAAVKGLGARAKAPIAATPYEWKDPASIPPRDWLYGRHLIRRYTSATIAPGGVGKTSLLVADALSLASGRPLLLDQAPKRRRVWLWNGEDPREELERRIQAAALHYGLKPVDLAGWLWVDSGRQTPINLATDSRSGLQIAVPVKDNLIATLRANRIDVFMVDPFISSHTVSENDNARIEAVVRVYNEIAEAAECAVELSHHTRKSGGGEELTAEDSRGASALKDKCRDVRVLNIMTRDEARQAGVEVTHRKVFFRVDDSLGKANMAPPSEAATWYQIRGVALPNGDNVGVVTSWSWPDAFDGLPADALARVQQTVHAGKWRKDPRATQWVGKAVAEALGLDLENERHRRQIRELIKTWTDMGALRDVDGTDDNGEKRKFVGVGIWAE